LAVGYLIQLPASVQVLALKIYRLFGIPWDTSRGSHAYLINRILMVFSTVVITVALLRLLYRYGRMQTTVDRSDAELSNDFDTLIGDSARSCRPLADRVLVKMAR
jgi:hypothetical protein